MPSFEFADWFNEKPLKLLAVAVFYTFAYRLVADYLAPQGRIDLFFIATGVALAALLLGGRIYALSVFFGCVYANLWGGLSLWIAVSIATGCTLNALLGSALVIHKKSFDLSLKSLPDYLRLIFFGGFLGCSIGTLIGTTTLRMAGLIPADQFTIELLRWSLDDILGVVLITPLILIWQKIHIHLLITKNWLKIAFIVSGTWLIGQIVFHDWYADWFVLIAKGYWLFAIVTLAATYLGRHGTLLVLLMIVTQAMIGATHRVGFFSHDLEQTQLLNFYFYAVCLSFVGIALAVHVDEQKSIELKLRESEELFKGIFDEAPLGIALVDSLTGQIYAANSMFAKIAGRSITEVIGMNRMHLTHPDDVQTDLDNTTLMLAGEISGFSMKKRFIRPDDSIVWINLSVAPMLVEDKSHPRHHCIIEDITERKQLEDAQLFLLECGYKQSGEDFFASLARFLAETLDMDFVCIDKLEPDGLRAETVAIYCDGHFQDNVCYTLHDTPCAEAVGKVICCFSENVRSQFPNDIMLQEMLAESYIGTTLWDFEGKPSGLIALISRKPLKNRQLTEALLKLVGIRAAGELERRKAETELQIAATIFESQEGMFVTNVNKIILKVNQAFTIITGYTAEEAVGQRPSLLRSGRHDKAFYQSLWLSINYTGAWHGEIWNCRKDGEIYPQWLNITAVKAGNKDIVSHYVATLIDISERKMAEDKIKHLAYYDALTNLPNRRALSERMKYSIHLARRDSKQMAVLMLDLDKFKPVNDSLGHAAGDILLQLVADRIKARLRDVDMVARLGGDEFVILLDEISQYDDVSRIAQDLIATLSQPFMLDQDRVQIGASIGISLYPHHGETPEILIDNADAALYLAKKQGRGCFAYFSEELTKLAHQRITLETRLRQAVEQQELCIHYQPQIDIRTGYIVGVEALVRWQDPNVGLIFPDDFMPIAETSNLFLLIAEWVLTESCRQGQQWLTAGLPKLTLTVNMSQQQFHRGDLNELVACALAETGFPGTQLELEISEAGLMTNQPQTLKILNGLHSQGIQLAIDNFGTGSSSFVALKHFPLTALKIDKSFIKDIPSSTNDMTITTTIINMAHNLGFKVLAKGVETAEQLVFLQKQGCDRYQGFYYSEALTAPDFVELLRKKAVV
jgi:diguanylate cyclase (GGDEF)-like protein/PAS domain S-box-containing protein